MLFVRFKSFKSFLYVAFISLGTAKIQPSDKLLSIFLISDSLVNLFERITSFLRFSHPAKASLRICSTLAGIFNDVSAVHPFNAFAPMILVLSLNTSFLSPVQPSKEFFNIFVILSLSTSFFNPVLPAKAFASSDVTLYFLLFTITASGISTADEFPS